MLQCRNTQPEAESKGALMQTIVCRASCGAKINSYFRGRENKKEK